MASASLVEPHSLKSADGIDNKPWPSISSSVLSENFAISTPTRTSTQTADNEPSQTTSETEKHTSPNLLVTSPYTTPEHLLNLSSVDPQTQLLAKALTTLAPTRPDYATAPYKESFNWDAVIQTLHALARGEGYTWARRSYYVVVFRSVLRKDADLELLHQLDVCSHREAVGSGGLLKYWFGVRNEKRENLATCVWRSREDARRGGTGPWHQRARGAARELYERIEFVTLELVVGEEDGEWEMKSS